MVIRPLRPEDIEPTVWMWHATKRAAYPYLPDEQTRTVEDDMRFFQGVIAPSCRVFIAELEDEIVGYLAIRDAYVDRLYVAVGRQRQGIGAALLATAKQLSPTQLELHTHQANTVACAFYEKHGFEVVEKGISPPPECAPDVRYRWVPCDAG